MSSNYYTYAWLREDGSPYYIGKGRGNRAYKGKRNFRPPDERILILKRNLTEEEAFRHEIYMIFVYGRKDLNTGILRNKTNGGDGSSGTVKSPESREKIGSFWRGRKRPNGGEKTRASQGGTKRQPWTAEQKAKLVGRVSPNKGKTMTEAQKLKISESKKGKPWSEARRSAQKRDHELRQSHRNLVAPPLSS